MDAKQLTELPDYVTYITAGLFLLVLIAMGALYITPGGSELNLYEDEENI